MVKKCWPILLLLVLIIPSVWALFAPGFFTTDDGEWMVIRFSAFYQSLADGQFPVRFLSRLNFGYGYPVANFLYPGFMYFAVPIHVLGFNFVNTIKVVLILSMAGAALFSYLWLSKIFDRFSAVFGSLVVTYAPYHLFDLYKRGSVGELFAFTWAAFVLWMIESKKILPISIGISLLVVSHNTIFLLFTPLLFVYSIVRKTISHKETVVSFTLGILMSSFFTIPAVYELAFTNFSSTKISNISEYFADFNLIGVSTFIILILSLIVYLQKSEKKSLFIFFLLVSVLSIFLSLQISKSVWEMLPSSLVQFPFRVLSYLIFSVAFLAAYSIYNFKKQKLVVGILILFLLLPSYYEYGLPKDKFIKDDSFYSTNEATTTVQDEYMPKWVKNKPIGHFEKKVEILKINGEIKNLSYDNKKIEFDFTSQGTSTIRINSIYYPGWKASVNGRQSPISYDNPDGVMELEVAPGNAKIKLIFGETPIRIVSDLVSVVSFGILLVWSIRKKIKHV